jgi:hypothetical protein
MSASVCLCSSSLACLLAFGRLQTDCIRTHTHTYSHTTGRSHNELEQKLSDLKIIIVAYVAYRAERTGIYMCVCKSTCFCSCIARDALCITIIIIIALASSCCHRQRRRRRRRHHHHPSTPCCALPI